MPSPPAWRVALEKQLPLLGHRNWIVVADAAYPWQASAGIETLDTASDHLEVLHAVLGAVAAARHVRALVHLDAELPFVDEAHAPGIGALRDALAQALEGRDARAVPHEEILRRLDEAGRAFRILLLKTTLALPYTSVFLELDCGYWSAEAEACLRQRVAEAP